MKIDCIKTFTWQEKVNINSFRSAEFYWFAKLWHTNSSHMVSYLLFQLHSWTKLIALVVKMWLCENGKLMFYINTTERVNEKVNNNTYLKWSCMATIISKESPLSAKPIPMNALRPAKVKNFFSDLTYTLV